MAGTATRSPFLRHGVSRRAVDNDMRAELRKALGLHPRPGGRAGLSALISLLDCVMPEDRLA